ncbi:MAG: hypothetical protein IMY84_00450, partial [Chloroflexi bacterium]|nr:hypothetical protein [Chloroflexota bacterium]
YRRRAPVERRISEIEEELPRLEREAREADLLLADPNHYSDPALVMETIERKRSLGERMSLLTGEWEELYAKLGGIRSEFEEQKGEIAV